MRKHPVVWFYILAFGITWLGMIPGALGSHGIAPFDSPYAVSPLTACGRNGTAGQQL